MAVASPCVRNCCLDKKDICIGCGRAMGEIIRWGEADDVGKLSILKKSTERIEQRKNKNK